MKIHTHEQLELPPLLSSPRYTAVDYAHLHGHDDCVKVLTEAGGVSTEDIHGLAALTIQTAYRGYR